MKILNFLALALVLFGGNSAWALSSPWRGDDEARARLVSATDGVGKEAQALLGLELKLGDGFHTYWRSPGDAGLPPALDWKNSQSDKGNIAEAKLLYPAPKRVVLMGMQTIGYAGSVLFPLEVKARRAGEAIRASVGADILICSKICIPKHFDLKLEIPAGSPKPSVEAGAIQKALASVPTKSSEIRIQKLERGKTFLKATMVSKDSLIAPDIFVENESGVNFKEPVREKTDNAKQAVFRFDVDGDMPDGVVLADLPLTLTAVDGDRSLEKSYSPNQVGEETQGSDLRAILAVLVTAFLGGLILNFMPCVLPVLSLKLLHVVKQSGESARQIRRHFLMTALGIVFSFLVLAAMTIGLRETGGAFGWGVQFQKPAFLAFLILVVGLFACNMFGFFEIRLPRFLADRIGASGGDFASGAFATLLATPCSAPFLGTAVGFALAASDMVIVAVFLALGVGMAIPYWVVAFFPWTAAKLPRPGAWMEKLKKILGLALAATALWLGWVLAAQIGAATKADTPWVTFEPEKIPALVAEGKTVFVDITADWCLTCKANKKFVLDSDEMKQKLFNNPRLVAMQGDWTQSNEAISAFLQRFGRYGIPFNAVFGPSESNGVLLPELLTPSAVREAIERAEDHR
jgi:suppressor for copper-sensitivity B